jgi:transglutaminase-like putative cysteine protease
MPKRIRITHITEYHYRVPVTFGPHRALLRPREGHDLHIVASRLEVRPDAGVRWYRDIYGNSIAILNFDAPARSLRVASEVDVDRFEDAPIAWTIDPTAMEYPVQYDPSEQVEILPYRLPSYPHDGPALREWLWGLYVPGQAVATSDLLESLNTRIHDTLKYDPREEAGVQLPCDTLRRGAGTCRDYAVLFMEAARHWGLAARFVTGYIQMREGQHGATHAWAEVYLPGAGWRGFDPTNNKLAGAEHVSVAVARAQETAVPLSGSWNGPPDAFERMEVTVQVVEV